MSYFFRNFILGQYDAVRLANFSHQVADSDRVVGAYYDGSVSLTFTGDDAQKIVRAVSRSCSARLPNNEEFTCAYGVKAVFWKGTNVLGEIWMYESLFLLDRNKPPFGDGSGLLATNVYKPLSEALRESWRTNDAVK